MNVEGLGAIITSELIQAVATGIPILVFAGLLWKWLRRWERQAVWARIGKPATELATKLGGEIEIWGPGYRLQAKVIEFHWLGGMWGERTVVVQQGHSREYVGFVMSHEDIQSVI